MAKHDYDKSITYYATARATIYFPNGEVRCNLCPCMETYARPQCRLSGEYLIFPDLTRGMRCPLEINDEIKEIKE